jgi:hypothetical protein
MAAKTKSAFPIEGGCTCRAVRYRMMTKPMFVHCCHCTWCQRETGSAFVINALIETDRVKVLSGKPELVLTPSNSGKGQNIARCMDCHVALWSHYPGAGPKAAFVRVGTLDNPNACPPDIHIFTSTKQKWVALPKGARAMKAYYKTAEEWPAESLKRRAAMAAK